MAAPGVEMSDIEQAFQWIGFTDAQTRILTEDVHDTEMLVHVTEKDIDDLAANNIRRKPSERVHLGIVKMKLLKAMISWVKDFAQVSEVPTIEGLDKGTFLEALLIASERNDIRKEMSSRSDALINEASPGKLKDGKKWNE